MVNSDYVDFRFRGNDKVYTYLMSKKSLPYIFLAFLFAVLLFILGVRYGQRVEQVNKTVSYLISIPPSPTTAPTSTPLAFSDYTHQGCKISFLLPNSLEKISDSSSSAVFLTRDKKPGISLSCEKNAFVKDDKELSVALNKTIRAYKTETKDTVSYRFYHVNTTQVVTLTVAKQYLPLIEKSIGLTSK